MAQRALIDLKKLGKDLGKISAKIAKIEDIATTRALNQLLLEERKTIGDEIAKDYGLQKMSVRSKITPFRATRVNKSIELHLRSARTNLSEASKIKGGISFRKQTGGRAKIKTAVKPGASKPFLIKATAGRSKDEIITKRGVKKVPVFVPVGKNRYRKIENRKVKTMRGSTIAKMAGDSQIDNKALQKRIIRKFPAEYKKQLKKASYTGRF